MDNIFKKWRLKIFAVSWLGYAGFYFCRKNFSVTMPIIIEELGYTKNDMALVLTAYSFTYMIGQFISGYMSDRFGPRIIVSIGLLIAVIANFTMGMTGSLMAFVFLMGTNGLGQSTGWSGLIKNMTPWYKPTERGVVMSWWSTCYVIGAFLATIFATYCATSDTFLVDLGWRRAYFAPAIVLVVITLLYATVTRNRPPDVGLPILVEDEEVHVSTKSKSEQYHIIKNLISKSELWVAASIYFVLKLTRYVFLFWLPMYMVEALSYSTQESGYLSSVYELVGFFGVIAAGYISDHFLNSRRFPVAAVMLFIMAGLCFIQPIIAGMGMLAIGINIGLIGVMTYGPDSILCGAAAMDIGGKKGAAMAAGIINGVGSAGQLLSPFIAAYFSETLGWNALFYGFVVLSLIGAILASTKWNFGGNLETAKAGN
ncbi:MAG: OPA family sugar phosphate sensor protein UhpC-like MFS transporter [Cyclobacteriaceae bacterium]|jgi:OPA family glycerol-3-phosphate transporter-like MFS transporter